MLHSNVRLSPMPLSVSSALNFIFEAGDDLSKIHLDLLMKPKPSFSVDPTFVEHIRTLRLWNRWAKKLSKVNARI